MHKSAFDEMSKALFSLLPDQFASRSSSRLRKSMVMHQTPASPTRVKITRLRVEV